MSISVIQWTTGNVGREALQAIIRHPELELVGCFAWSEDKVGRDAGELAGLQKVGVSASNDIEALLAMQPDCVNYNPLWPNVDELTRILEAGINVTTTAAFITGHALGESGRERIEQACKKGNSSIFGSGMNPGFANLLGLVSAGICDRIDSISVLESVDSTGYGSAETEQSVGYGAALDDPNLVEKSRKGSAVFGDGVHLMADALGITLDEIKFTATYAAATQALDLGYMRIEEGCVAGIECNWQGWYKGRAVINLRVRWRKGRHLEPDWPLEHGYVVEIEGRPNIKTKLEISPPADFVAETMQDYMQLGMIITALPAVNAIPATCAATPGIKTYRDLPLITAAGFVS